MEIYDRIPLGPEAAILGSRFVAQTDDDRVVYRIISTCGENVLFEVIDDQAFIIAGNATVEELEEYAVGLAEGGA